MKEKTILKISLVLVFIGLTFLYFYSSELNLSAIENYDNLPSAESVKTTGIVEQVSVSDKVTFLKMSALTEQQLDVIVFNNQNLFVQPGDTVEVLGQMEVYNGKSEIIASQIIVK